MVEGKGALFPCVGCLGDGAGRDHVQQILPLALHGRAGLVGGQAGVHVRHGDTCRGKRHISEPGATPVGVLMNTHFSPSYPMTKHSLNRNVHPPLIRQRTNIQHYVLAINSYEDKDTRIKEIAKKDEAKVAGMS